MLGLTLYYRIIDVRGNSCCFYCSLQRCRTQPEKASSQDSYCCKKNTNLSWQLKYKFEQLKYQKAFHFFFAGEKKSFYCFVEGLSPPTVRWLMNNDVLNETKSQRDKRVDLTLDFPELDLHHTGNYTCEASNYNITTKKRSILITVTCKNLLLTTLFSLVYPLKKVITLHLMTLSFTTTKTSKEKGTCKTTNKEVQGFVGFKRQPNKTQHFVPFSGRCRLSDEGRVRSSTLK